MAENVWSHLQEIVDALTAAGNSVQPPGFHPTQGGWECGTTGPLDPDIAAASINADPRLTYQDDELSCSHCWSAITGSEAQARYRRAYQAARQQLTRHATSTDCDLCSDAWLPYIHGQYLRLATDFGRHAELCQCPQCGSLYEVFPEDRKGPARLTVEQSRRLYPGVL